MITPHTSLCLMTHWISQARSSLSLALLNAVATSAFIVSIVISFWDLKDFMAWSNCACISFPENQKECSAKRATTKRIVSYLFENNKFIIPAIAWILESP